MLRLYIIEDVRNTDGYGHKQEQAICQHCAGSSQRIGISVPGGHRLHGGWRIHGKTRGCICAFVILGGEYYRLFTAMFLHFGVSHLANNMLVLLVLGEKMERALGHIKYLIFYLVSGVAANSISLAVQVRTGQASVSAGASGAIFGVVGGLVYVIAIHHGQLDGLTNRQLGFMVLLTLYHGFTSAGVDNMAHIGGLISGFILGILLYRRKDAARISGMAG